MPRLIRAALEGSGVDRPEHGSSGVDVVGDIAILRLPGFSVGEKKAIARTLLEEMKTAKVILEQEGGIEGEFRLRRLKHLAGEHRTLTVHRENGCKFRVDVAKCYFSPRLSTERLRVARLVRAKERVLNMFAGVGPYSILVARIAGAKVTSCELNTYAVKLHQENNELNKVDGLVTVIEGDAAKLPSLTRTRFERILMPHPSEAYMFLPTALRMARGGAALHYYRHVLGENEEEAAEALRGELSELLPEGAKCAIRKVREVGPRWIEMVADIRLSV